MPANDARGEELKRVEWDVAYRKQMVARYKKWWSEIEEEAGRRGVKLKEPNEIEESQRFGSQAREVRSWRRKLDQSIKEYHKLHGFFSTSSSVPASDIAEDKLMRLEDPATIVNRELAKPVTSDESATAGAATQNAGLFGKLVPRAAEPHRGTTPTQEPGNRITGNGSIAAVAHRNAGGGFSNFARHPFAATGQALAPHHSGSGAEGTQAEATMHQVPVRRTTDNTSTAANSLLELARHPMVNTGQASAPHHSDPQRVDAEPARDTVRDESAAASGLMELQQHPVEHNNQGVEKPQGNGGFHLSSLLNPVRKYNSDH
ncbi:MAG: hypothetical protein Q9162_007211 [Coniocarpon cinnabarinum]